MGSLGGGREGLSLRERRTQGGTEGGRERGREGSEEWGTEERRSDGERWTEGRREGLRGTERGARRARIRKKYCEFSLTIALFFQTISEFSPYSLFKFF